MLHPSLPFILVIEMLVNSVCGNCFISQIITIWCIEFRTFSKRANARITASALFHATFIASNTTKRFAYIRRPKVGVPPSYLSFFRQTIFRRGIHHHYAQLCPKMIDQNMLAVVSILRGMLYGGLYGQCECEICLANHFMRKIQMNRPQPWSAVHVSGRRGPFARFAKPLDRAQSQRRWCLCFSVCLWHMMAF